MTWLDTTGPLNMATLDGSTKTVSIKTSRIPSECQTYSGWELWFFGNAPSWISHEPAHNEIYFSITMDDATAWSVSETNPFGTFSLPVGIRAKRKRAVIKLEPDSANQFEV